MFAEECNTKLGLAIGGVDDGYRNKPMVKQPVQLDICLFPSGLKEEILEEETRSFGDVSYNMSKTKKSYRDEEMMMGDGTRKKLRLTKEQSALLEESFRDHSTLNSNQKNELATRLNLRPRQVEVWFQNRRARTKLKQTEVDCEILKKCCESLSNENRRLKKELQELRAVKGVASSPLPFYDHLQSAVTALAICPSCERAAAAAGNSMSRGGSGSTSSSRSSSMSC